MDLFPDGVAKAVYEGVAITVGGDMVAGDLVNLPTLDAPPLPHGGIRSSEG